LSLHDALPIFPGSSHSPSRQQWSTAWHGPLMTNTFFPPEMITRYRSGMSRTNASFLPTKDTVARYTVWHGPLTANESPRPVLITPSRSGTRPLVLIYSPTGAIAVMYQMWHGPLTANES